MKCFRNCITNAKIKYKLQTVDNKDENGGGDGHRLLNIINYFIRVRDIASLSLQITFIRVRNN